MQNTLTRKIYGASAASTNDLAHIDIGYRCRVIGFQFNIVAPGAAASDACHAQVSVASVNSILTNDPQGVIAELGLTYIMVTSGASAQNASSSISGLNLVLPAGTRVYLHTIQTGTSVTRCTCILYLEPF